MSPPIEESPVPESLTWHIGKEGTMKSRLDVPPYRAYFVWLENNLVTRSADFSYEELVAEVSQIEESGAEFADYLAALSALNRANKETP